MKRRPSLVLALLVIVTGCTSSEPETAGPFPSGSPSSASTPTAGGGSPSARVLGPSGAWRDVSRAALGKTGDWTNKAEVADLDLDGDLDLLFANGGDYESPGRPVSSRVFLNSGDGTFVDETHRVFGRTRALARAIQVADFNGDGLPDIVVGTTYHTPSRLYLGDRKGWIDVTRESLPTALLSVGDLEPADVDRDGDLDLVLADWGDGSPMSNRGGRVRLWLNDGAARFADATADRLPKTLVKFSWDLEPVDVDNDWDLDLAVSCKVCETSLLYLNDGRGRFTDVTSKRMPAYSNNYEFEPIDLDGDGFLDLVTVNDGASRPAGLAEHVFRNDGSGRFVDVTERWWPQESNPGYDDNVVVGLDVESDGDADFVVGSLDGPDRLLINDGRGRLTLVDDVFDAEPSRGTLGMALGDLNGDGRIDVVEAQGEAPGYEDERVYFGTEVLSQDTAAPIIRAALRKRGVVARIHDNRTPYLAADWRATTVRWKGGRRPMTWFGEHLFYAALPRGIRVLEVCASDIAGNRTCARPE